MGFESPYDVDKAGRRADFQNRLLSEKMAWENAHDEFVTDRITLDNLVYTMFHDIHSITEKALETALYGLRRYTLIIYCPFSVYCNPNGDKARVSDMTYHRLYDTVIHSMLLNNLPKTTWYREMNMENLETRKSTLRWYIDRKVPRP